MVVLHNLISRYLKSWNTCSMNQPLLLFDGTIDFPLLHCMEVVHFGPASSMSLIIEQT